MNINIEHLRKQLQAFDFRKLFINELGWDKTNTDISIQLDGQEYALQAVAQKRGLVALHYPTPAGQAFPDYATRRKIDAKVRKTFHEHLIIFTDAGNAQQKWQWVRREPGKPSAGREIGFGRGQTGEGLLQRLQTLAFSLEEEEGLTIIDVTSRVRAGFDLERVTKRFYERFKTEHALFLKFLEGIPDEEMQRWYVSVTINRLMFVYFIQWKGFLDSDSHYLRNRLEHTRQQFGDNHFYRDFLCPLFFEGFAQKERTPQTHALLGNVPYLNGGIFQRHQLEERFGQAIQIPDTAFTRLFDFFDGYSWHLDERPLRADNEINPDVLGFIFEKYINQKQMGAYYTKEDITGYISKYTILPSVFERTCKDCKIAFEGENAIWRHLAIDPDRYIYPAMLKGLDLALPEVIAAGVIDVAQRGEWNRPTDEPYALPTEIWRETIARRQRAEEIRAHLVAGEASEINDLITYNLDIQQFAQDVIEWSEGPELVRAFWKTLTDIKVLDPTCGSGAFLFAALNTLEPLYEACLDRMQSFVDELDAGISQGEKHHPEKLSDFRRILIQVAHHSNRSYFIFKSIIVKNLYGVDIMEEAVEICKLRLFLKLISQVESADKIEPLPDIDFNVHAGNTLIGFASREEVRKALTSQGGQVTLGLFGENEAVDKLEEQAELANRAFQRFQQMQTAEEMDATAFSSAKVELRKRLSLLNEELNKGLAVNYLAKPIDPNAYENWLQTHQPFHWFVDFYGIMHSGGFDVIIGNPPYVETKNVQTYQTIGFETEACGDLYALVLERSITLAKENSFFGFIVPLSCFSVDGFRSLQTYIVQNASNLYISNWSGDAHPSKLFEGVDKRLEIIVGERNKSRAQAEIYTTKYIKWYADERPILFSTRPFYAHLSTNDFIFPSSCPKVQIKMDLDILQKIRTGTKIGTVLTKTSRYKLYYTRKVSFFLQFMNFVPEVRDQNGILRDPSELKVLNFQNEVIRNLALAALTSSIFYWFNIINSDCRNLNKREIVSFSLPKNTSSIDEKELKLIIENLMASYIENSSLRTVKYADLGEITVQYFNFRPSKQIIDKCDHLLGPLFGLSSTEIDYIINYDIKYRLGTNIENVEEE